MHKFLLVALLAQTLTRTPVPVEATFVDNFEGAFHVRILLHGSERTESVGTVIVAKDEATALASLRQAVVWKPPYLLVRAECGGGNRHDCYREAVFKVVDTRVERLGQLVANDANPPGLTFRHGRRFVDVCEQSVSALCHACWPSFFVELEEADGKFSVLPQETWDANRSTWNEDAAFLSQHPAGDEERFLIALTRSALLAKYVGRESELAALMRDSASALTPQNRQVLTAALAKVMPLQPPSAGRKDISD